MHPLNMIACAFYRTNQSYIHTQNKVLLKSLLKPHLCFPQINNKLAFLNEKRTLNHIYMFVYLSFPNI